MKIYTKTGDGGETGLYGGTRLPKDALRVEACGAVDEVNSLLGLAACAGPDAEMAALLTELQELLFTLGADLATPLAVEQPVRISAGQVTRLEEWIDRLWPQLEPMRHFVLPGGTELAARLHVARTAARRAERQTVALARQEDISVHAVPLLNRLSDLLFAMARLANHRAGVPDVHWLGRAAVRAED